MVNSKYKPLIYIVGIFGFYFILFSKIDFGGTLNIFKNINLYIFILSLFIGIPYFLMANVRWNLLLKSQGIAYSYRNSLIIYLVGVSIGTITPGKLGELAKFYYLKKDGNPSLPSLLVTLVDRILDLIILALIAYICFLRFFSININYLSLPLIGILIIYLALFIYKRKTIICKICDFVIAKKFHEEILSNCNYSRLDLKMPTNSQLIAVVILSLLLSALVFMYLSIGLFLQH